MFTGSESHGMNVPSRKLVENNLAGFFAILLQSLCVGEESFVNKLPQLFLEGAMMLPCGQRQ
jgi:hypothetical protein